MVEFIVKLGVFLFGNRWNSILASFVNLYLSNKFVRSYKVSKQLVTSKMLIYMADGKMRHGGISDRLRGAVSVYKLCKKMGLVFKINFVHPFELNDYLVPNMYDWYISPEEIVYDRRKSSPVVRSTGLSERMWKIQEKRMAAKVKKHKMQYHIYTNACFAESEFHDLFAELFKPSFKLQSLIDENLKNLGGDYISISYRFQQALGDFKDSPSKILKEKDASILIKKCLDACSYIHEIAPFHKKILITSDSARFINEVRCFSYVYIIPGDIATRNTDRKNRLKFIHTISIFQKEKLSTLLSPQIIFYTKTFLNSYDFVFNTTYHSPSHSKSTIIHFLRHNIICFLGF